MRDAQGAGIVPGEGYLACLEAARVARRAIRLNLLYAPMHDNVCYVNLRNGSRSVTQACPALPAPTAGVVTDPDPV